MIEINSTVVKLYSPSERIGVKDYTMLDSAINRTKQSAFGEDAYKTIFEKWL